MTYLATVMPLQRIETAMTITIIAWLASNSRKVWSDRAGLVTVSGTIVGLPLGHSGRSLYDAPDGLVCFLLSGKAAGR